MGKTSGDAVIKRRFRDRLKTLFCQKCALAWLVPKPWNNNSKKHSFLLPVYLKNGSILLALEEHKWPPFFILFKYLFSLCGCKRIKI
jgi:hypothetical protein